MSLYQSLREPPILTAVIGAECKDGIVLVADTKLVRGVNKQPEIKLDEKIKADLEHFIVGYAGTEKTFEIFRKYMVGELMLEYSTQKLLHPNNVLRAANCVNKLNDVAKTEQIKILAVNHQSENSHLYYINEHGNIFRIPYQAIGSGQEVADHFCKSSLRKQIFMKEFAAQAYLAIKFMEQGRPDLFVGGEPTIKYMKKNEIWDIFAPDKDKKEFEQYAKKYLKNSDRRMRSIAASSKRDLLKRKQS
jgi:20S proteasome alpha/beta subunit